MLCQCEKEEVPTNKINMKEIEVEIDANARFNRLRFLITLQ